MDPLLFSIVPSSITVTPSAVTFSPILPEKIDVPFLLKSPSKPCPTASWSITPGQPGPNITGISPAGVGIDSRLVLAILSASFTCPFHLSELIHSSYFPLPPQPELPVSRLPFFSTTSDTFNLTKGLMSAVLSPSALSIWMAWWDAETEAETWTTLVSKDLAYASISSRRFVFIWNDVPSIGLSDVYKGLLIPWDGAGAIIPE